MGQVTETIELLIDEYRLETGRKPAGLLLGPLEYLDLCDYVARTQKAMKDASVFGNFVTQFKGYPVYVKELPGIELMISHLDAHNYRKT